MARTRVHLIYPAGPEIGCPQAIGRHLSSLLAGRFEVILYDWDSLDAITPGENDVLLGHPHPGFGTIFKRSMVLPGWRRRIVMAPFNGDPRQVSYLRGPLETCEQFLAISGPYWFEALPKTPFRAWAPKMFRLDLAVDRAEFPRLKGAFNPAGRRRFAYLGHSGFPKNTDYL